MFCVCDLWQDSSLEGLLTLEQFNSPECRKDSGWKSKIEISGPQRVTPKDEKKVARTPRPKSMGAEDLPIHRMQR